ncbi:hypothetical protein MNBD_NITROSPINAE01-474 [hydrothermal vent metagenome]|uniref:Amine oxidase domain-containing protein n=1 Tax=hydrothermal vent metagenome TaxID=652676 RepID=A0A3B1BPI7_9ZZZZ
MEAIVLGAGPCGLTAAWELAKRGVNVTVVEKDDVVGGLCKTVRHGDYRFDLGGHRFISKDEELVEQVKTLMGNSLLRRSRKSCIRFKDRQFDYPINIPNILSQSSARDCFRFATGYLASAAGFYHSKAPKSSFEAWVDKSFGRPLNEYFFKPYTEKLWGISAGELSDEWAGQRISLLNAKDAILKSLSITREKPRTYAVHYLYPKHGIGQIFTAMADDIKRMGGKIITGFKPVEFKISESKIEGVVIENETGEGKILTASKFLSTIPINELVKLLDPGSEEILGYRSLRFLNITLNGLTNLSDNTWMYTPEADIIMTRIQEPKRRSPLSAPEGKTSVMLEIPCLYMDKTWTMPDGELLDIVLADLKTLGLDLRPHVDEVFSSYAQNAYPILKLGSAGHVKSLRKKVARFTNIATAGRQGLFKYIFMDTAMLMGRQWARNILGESARRVTIDTIHSEAKLLESESMV